MSNLVDYYLCYKEAFLLGVSFGVFISYTFVCFLSKKALQNHR